LTSGPQRESATAFQRWKSLMKDRVSIGDRDPGLRAEIVVVRSSHPNRPLIRPSYYRIKCYRVAGSPLRRKPECSQDSGPARASQTRLNGVQHKGRTVVSGARRRPPEPPRRSRFGWPDSTSKKFRSPGYGVLSDDRG